MTPAQCRAGRTLAGMSHFDLSAVAAVPQKRLMDFENNVGNLGAGDLAAVQAALEHMGVEFIEDGVRLRK